MTQGVISLGRFLENVSKKTGRGEEDTWRSIEGSELMGGHPTQDPFAQRARGIKHRRIVEQIGMEWPSNAFEMFRRLTQ
jgi:hypothetical protein